MPRARGQDQPPRRPAGHQNPAAPTQPEFRLRGIGAGPVLTHSPSISTATKYRNTTTAICHPARLCATLPCSTTNMVAVARSSGRRGRRFNACHRLVFPHQRPAAPSEKDEERPAFLLRSPRETPLPLFIERPPLRIGTPSPSSASGGRSYVAHRHAERLSMPRLVCVGRRHYLV